MEGHTEVLRALVNGVLTNGHTYVRLNSSLRWGGWGGGDGERQQGLLVMVMVDGVLRLQSQGEYCIQDSEGCSLYAAGLFVACASPQPAPHTRRASRVLTMVCVLAHRRMLSMARPAEVIVFECLNWRSGFVGLTPLILAARAGRVGTIEYLLSAGERPGGGGGGQEGVGGG